ncbi:DHA2 family efflux MFS transporter permease subunit [Dactylosporangium sucinum]|nr:DHA2 family efflux MFS transporter permease subunit [Dactylosporangium sucinum]
MRTQRWALGLSSAASFMVVLDMLVVATALSSIRRDLGASLAELEWTVNAYTLSFAVLLLTGAALGDRFGRRRMFAAGLGLFTAASAACALAPSAGALIAARAVQGAGAAVIMPLALATLNAAFPPERRGWATGVYGGVTGLAAVVGPVVGGAVAQGLAWEWIFWLNLPVGLAAIPLVLTRTAEHRGAPARIDLPGLVLAAVAAFGLTWSLVRGEPIAAAAGLAGAVAFVLWERRAAAPMLPLRLFRSRPFAAGNVAIFFVNAALTGAIFFLAQMWQESYGQSPLSAGLRLLPIGVAPLLLAPRAGAWADRFGERSLIAAGGMVLAAALGWLAAAPTFPVAAPALMGLGITLAVPAATRAVVSRVAPPEMAKASGTFSTLRQLGGAFGVAAAGAAFAGGAAPVCGLMAALALGGAAGGLLLERRQRLEVLVEPDARQQPA